MHCRRNGIPGRGTLALSGGHAHERQTRGKSGQLVDPRPQTTASGDIRITITPKVSSKYHWEASLNHMLNSNGQ